MPKIDLPFHPRTGLQAVGLLRNGSPIWPVLGGSGEDDDVIVSDTDDPADADSAQDDDDADSDTADADRPNDKGDDDKPLGPKGEKALQAEKDRRREADRLRRQAARERDEALAELDRLRKAAEKKPDAGDDADKGPDLDAIRAEAREKATAELRAEVLKDRVSDKIEVLAAKRFQDAGDAVTHLMRSGEIEDFLDGGKVDAEAITEALDALLEKKPYLAVAAQSAKRFQGSGDGGARKGPQKPAQLNEADLRRMSAEQIVKAQDEGRFDDLLGVSR